MTDPLFEPRVRWLCRRGMKEVEDLVNPFFEAHYRHMDMNDKKQFVQLLEESDPDLYMWLLQQAEPTDPNHRLIIDRILSYVSP